MIMVTILNDGDHYAFVIARKNTQELVLFDGLKKESTLVMLVLP